MNDLKQWPEPGTRMVTYTGEVITLRLTVFPALGAGHGWVRSNIGRAGMRRREIVGRVEQEIPIRFRDWHDIPMRATEAGDFELTLPLTEVGIFEAKIFWLPEGGHEPRWPGGDNVVIKVEPADTVCGNTIYTAFVRQFGPNRGSEKAVDTHTPAARELEAAGYTVIPRSGTFQDLIGGLDTIIGTMGFRILQLLPIHPTPTTFGRMGRFGSPFAALDLMDVDPALASFDRRTTPLEQFRELLDETHWRGAKLFMDMPINHTGWASSLQVAHPEWFVRNDDETFKSPGAWGVTWEDLSELDYGYLALWEYMADVFLYWCQQGVDGFRCDAGYMVPYRVWEYVIARVRATYPDTVFLLEGLGGKLEVVEQLLGGANLNWAYSELFQVMSRNDCERYLPGSDDLSTRHGLLVHFAETHDNNRLASRSQAWASLRTALSALVSHAGGFGITNGLEWFADEKIMVHEANGLRWGNANNQVDRLARLNAVLAVHPAFGAGASVTMIQQGYDNVLVVLRVYASERVLVLVNLSDSQDQTAQWDATCFHGDAIDLLSGGTVTTRQEGASCYLSLSPGQAYCLADRPDWLDRVEESAKPGRAEPATIGRQRLRAKAWEIHNAWHGVGDVAGVDSEARLRLLACDPRAFCGVCLGQDYAPVVTWRWPSDCRRVVMIPPDHALLMEADSRFTATFMADEQVCRREHSLSREDGRAFILLAPEATRHGRWRVDLTVFAAEGQQSASGTLLFLTSEEPPLVSPVRLAPEIERQNLYMLCTHESNTMAQVRAAWGTIRSQYDALLSVNLNPSIPVDRHVMWTRCRIWLVHRGYSVPVDRACLDAVASSGSQAAFWHFSVPAGLGKQVRLQLRLTLAAPGNVARLDCIRERAASEEELGDEAPIRLICRPDIEDRQAHAKTKAYAGPEQQWPGAIQAHPDHFDFTPAPDRRLRLAISSGAFVSEPEWQYMVGHPLEAGRGLGSSSDLYSPGYFRSELRGGEMVSLTGTVNTAPAPLSDGDRAAGASPFADPESLPLMASMQRAMQQFIVRRDHLKTVIAGYPWFLDWGRDTMICLRGLIAAGLHTEARAILLEFAGFEDGGTLPNVIHGSDVSNRDTSDAPLWFFVACGDLLKAEGRDSFLEADCGGRRVADVLSSIVRHYRDGTANGIRMDDASGLIFSPSHFTWMDTNYPAGTPREGYPIEIQALWHYALRLLQRVESDSSWGQLADQVQDSLMRFFAIPEKRYLADCLVASPGVPAAAAERDDACRPNQLFALTLDAISDIELGAGVLQACEALLVPGAIRSLADQPVGRPLPIRRDGQLLNDPSRPYWGRYEGDEDTRRKPAYHNGTAWTWPFPSYPEALVKIYGPPAKPAARALLTSAIELVQRGCLLQIPEIVDGDAPHTQRGCGAQAWGCTELYRVLAELGPES
ncbi:MAG: glycogen debranching enzyme N-terminal domain-containing protein [Verrucomicrobia bacterium]|nr:glycogen debranching enzyme N-terminal domain-containing protein [Verrucomicrobiota bacterium]